jgi:hypothetical protein
MLFSACSKAAEAPKPDETPPPAVTARTADVPEARTADAGSSSGRITITARAPRSPARPALAKRCVLGGDPVPADCVGGGEGIALGKDGTLLVVAGKTVRRYRRAGAASAGSGDAAAEPRECRFEPSGEPIELPPDHPRPQKLDGGPVYMRSGGPAWQLVRAGDIVYAHDFLGGLFRIDRGKLEPACESVFGYKTVAALGKRLLVARKGIEELRPGKQCTAVATKLDDKARGELYAIRDRLYRTSGRELVRYDGVTPKQLGPATPVALGEGTRICHIASMSACGEGACVLDSNCKQLVQLAADGKVLRVIDDDQLFSTPPWTLRALATSEAGEVYVLAKHRDTPDGKPASDQAICEAAIYEVPAAAFAL